MNPTGNPALPEHSRQRLVAPVVYTFYSFKGGVGRSMAMANIAEFLYRQGNDVIIVDWDLEAPGIENYFYHGASNLEQISSKPGLIDLLEAYKAHYQQSQLSASLNRTDDKLPASVVEETLEHLSQALTAKDVEQLEERISALLEADGQYQVVPAVVRIIAGELEHYFRGENFDRSLVSGSLQAMLRPVLPAQQPDHMQAAVTAMPPLTSYLQAIRPALEEEQASLRLLSAGQRAGDYFSAYVAKIQNFNYTRFYADFEGERFFDWFRASLLELGNMVLIDSRTGVTEMGGVCTRQLSDTVILLTAPNPQNLSGVTEMVRSINREDVQAARGRPVRTLVIPSRLDNSETKEQNNFRVEFTRIIGGVLSKEKAEECLNYAIPYIPRYTYHDVLVMGAQEEISRQIKSAKNVDLEKAYANLARFIMARDADLPQAHEGGKPQATATVTAVNPFGSSTVFSEKGPVYFYGRNVELIEMQQKLAAQHLLIVTGPSGSGKSSLVKAGLVPTLKNKSETAAERLYYATFRPGRQPLKALGEVLGVTVDDLKLRDQKDIYAAIREIARDYRNAGILPEEIRAAGRIVLVVDNTEDLFILADHKTATSFLSLLEQFVQSGLADIIFVVRSEYCSTMRENFEHKSRFDKSIVNLSVLGIDESRKMIEEPAMKAGLMLEEGLAERLLKDIDNARGKMHILRFTLSQLWEQRAENVLTHKAYDSLPQIDGVLVRITEGAMNALNPTRLELLRPLLSRLVNINTGHSQPVNVSGLDEERLEALSPLLEQGVVAIGYDNISGNTTLELAHPRLALVWEALKSWAQANQDFMSWTEGLSKDIAKWKASAKPEDQLLKGVRLARAKKELELNEKHLLPQELRFVRASIAANKTTSRKAAVLLVLALVAVGIGVWAIQRYRTSEERVQEFRNRLAVVDTMQNIGQRQQAICELAHEKFLNPERFIDSTQNALKNQCTILQRLQRVTQSIAQKDSGITAIGALLDLDPSFQTDLLELENLDSGVLQRSALLSTSKSREHQYSLLHDTTARGRSQAATRILTKNSNFSKAAALNRDLQELYRQEDSLRRLSGLSSGSLDGGRSTWLKERDVWMFENLRLFVGKVDPSKQLILLQICYYRSDNDCLNELSAEVRLGQPYLFTINDQDYMLLLNRFGRGGYNPFSDAVFLSIQKKQG